MMSQDCRARFAALDITPIGEAQALAGGDVAAVWRMATTQGEVVIKQDAAETLAAEADGLRVLREAETSLRVPAVIAVDDDLLVMEALDSLPHGHRDEARLGEGLRQLHATTAANHGGGRDNRCGSTPQCNTPCSDGRVFQREHRLLALAGACCQRGLLDNDKLDALTGIARRLEEWLPDTPPSLVHGDLWSGNVLYTPQGPAIIDPAVYYHYPEVDLAMLTLFGVPGSDPSGVAFFEAYWDGAEPADWPRRQTLFQLYPLLNHLLLFGTGYHAAVARSIAQLT